MADKSYSLLNVKVNALTITDLNGLVAKAVEQNRQWIIANHNLHSVYLHQRDPKMRTFYAKAAYTHIDGMPLIWLGKLLGFPLQRKHRNGYMDWMNPLMTKATQQGWRVFYLGSKPGVANQGATLLQQKFPGLQIATAHGYFDARPDSQENQALIEAINAYQPHILMVGMGMPRQEQWVVDNLAHLSANVILNSGAAMDYIADVIPTPPRWLGKVGLEWLFRLITEPSRLWSRYLVEPWFILGWFLACYLQSTLSVALNSTIGAYTQKTTGKVVN